MTLAELQRLVSKGEGKQLEFKHKIQFPEKVAREIVAFCNTMGGTLLIGVDDNKQIFGLKNPEEEIFTLDQILRQYIRFPVNCTIEKIKISDKKTVIKVDVDVSPLKPNYALEKPNMRYGKAYVRHEDKSIQASDLVVDLLKRSNKPQKPFTMGKTEQDILKFIDTHQKVTLQKLADSLLLSPIVLQKIIVEMLVNKILRITPKENDQDILELYF